MACKIAGRCRSRDVRFNCHPTYLHRWQKSGKERRKKESSKSVGNRHDREIGDKALLQVIKPSM